MFTLVFIALLLTYSIDSAVIFNVALRTTLGPLSALASVLLLATIYIQTVETLDPKQVRCVFILVTPLNI